MIEDDNRKDVGKARKPGSDDCNVKDMQATSDRVTSHSGEVNRYRNGMKYICQIQVSLGKALYGQKRMH